MHYRSFSFSIIEVYTLEKTNGGVSTCKIISRLRAFLHLAKFKMAVTYETLFQY